MDAQIHHQEIHGALVGKEASQKKAQPILAQSRQGSKKGSNHKKRWYFGDGVQGYLFILPSIIGFAVFVVYPLISSAYYSLTKWNGVSDPVFVGFKNYLNLFTADPSFFPSIKATLLFTLMSVPASLVIGLLLAVLLNRTLPGIKLFRTALYLPAVLPSIATLTLWKFIYDPQIGLANQVLNFFNLPTSSWLSSYTLALPAIVIIGIWGIGSTMIIFLAGLQAVPQDIYEAAKLDGAGPVGLFLRTTLPMISPIIFLQLILQIITALQAFNQFQVITVPGGTAGSNVKGGPGFTTDVLMLQIYQRGFADLGQTPQLGYAVAEVWVLFLFIMVVTFFTFRFSSMWVYEESSID